MLKTIHKRTREDIMSSGKKRVVLDNYAIFIEEQGTDPKSDDRYKPKVAAGFVSGHPKFPNGSKIQTARLVWYDVSQGIAATENTIYLLGEPDKEYKNYMESLGLKAGSFQEDVA